MSIIDDIVTLQNFAGVTPDGIFGAQTARALVLKLGLDQSPQIPVPVAGEPVDERSEKNIATLLPEVQPIARELVRQAARKGIQIKIISGTRSYAEQDALYAQGRTAPGSKVTNARGGYSNHNFGIAFDVGVFDGNNYIPESPKYKTVGQIGKALNLLWGGDWTSIVDEPHFEYNPKKHSLATLRELKSEGKSPFA